MTMIVFSRYCNVKCAGGLYLERHGIIVLTVKLYTRHALAPLRRATSRR